MKMEYILTIDVGTTSVKCCIFDSKLHQVETVSAEYSLITPSREIVEADPELYLEKIYECIKALRFAGADTGKIRYLTATTQGETLIPLDDKNVPASNAVVWLDSRAQEEAEDLGTHFDSDLYYRTTGLPGLDGYAPIAKIKKLMKQFAREGRKVSKFLLLEDFLIWKLTGRMVTEKTLLSSTGYFDIRQDRIWEEILYASDIRLDSVPEVLESGQIVGKVLPEMADYLNISRDTVVVTGAMDQICGAVGCGNLSAGRLHETTGTAMVIGASTDAPDFENRYRITIYRHAVRGLYLLLPICRTAAIIQKWFKEQFCEEEAKRARETGQSVYDYLAQIAQNTEFRSEGPLLLPYFNGSLAPVSIDTARGCFWGIGLDTTKADFIRAVPEGIAFMLRENLDMLEKMGIKENSFYFGGGPSKNPFWCQLKADITGKEVLAADGLESTSFGAACLAATAAGYFDSLESAAAAEQSYKRFLPQKEVHEVYRKKYELYRRLVCCAESFYNQQGREDSL